VDKFVLIATTEKNAKTLIAFSICFSINYSTTFICFMLLLKGFPVLDFPGALKIDQL
jgi:hypothetical protein